MLKNSIQAIEYYKLKQKQQLRQLAYFLIFGFSIITIFNRIEQVLGISYGFGFAFLGLCLCFLIYCLPTKKEYGNWKKKNFIA